MREGELVLLLPPFISRASLAVGFAPANRHEQNSAVEAEGDDMYARLVRFGLGAGKRSVVQGLADELVPLISSQPGCKSVTVFGDDSNGECGLFVLWESQAN